MYCIVFSCVVYSRLKAFRNKRENKNPGKINHSTVYSQTFIKRPPNVKTKVRSLKTGGLLLLGHLNCSITPGEVKMQYLNKACLLSRFDCITMTL